MAQQTNAPAYLYRNKTTGETYVAAKPWRRDEKAKWHKNWDEVPLVELTFERLQVLSRFISKEVGRPDVSLFSLADAMLILRGEKDGT